MLLIYLLTIVNPIAASQDFSFAGVVDGIQASSVIIDDTVLEISGDVSVYSIAGYTTTLDSISVGSKIGVNFVSLGTNSWLVTEIYKLRDSYDLSEGPSRGALYGLKKP